MDTAVQHTDRKVVTIIQARMGSQRLPGKMMLPLAGKPMLQRVIERAKELKTPDAIILATSTNRENDVLADVALSEGIEVHRGPEEDVLQRFLGAAAQTHADIILRICGDAPLFDVETADAAVRHLREHEIDVVFVNTANAPLLGGFEAVTQSALRRVAAMTADPFDAFAREHVSVFLGLNPRYYPEKNSEFTRDLLEPRAEFTSSDLNLRAIVDTPEDYEIVRHLYDDYCTEGGIVSLERIITAQKPRVQ